MSEIAETIAELMDSVMASVLEENPFVPQAHHEKRPLYAALVPDEIFKGSHFERRFVTRFGGVWEKLAYAVASAYHGDCTRAQVIEGNIPAERVRRIHEVLDRLEHGGREERPDWTRKIAYINMGDGTPVPTTVVADIHIDSSTADLRYAFEIKAPLPNSDQTKVSKEKLFKLLAMKPCPIDAAYFALPYNPYGTRREDYAWTFPMRWFDMHADPCVLIGEEFWELVGGPGAYRALVMEVNNLGARYKERICREYLGLEPPNNMGMTLK